MNEKVEAPSATDSSKKYSVFISHKASDHNVTSELKDLLDHYTENIDFFISDDIEKGEDWRKIISQQLNRANFLVLVFTDPNEDWEWCLYQTGFFDALS